MVTYFSIRRHCVGCRTIRKLCAPLVRIEQTSGGWTLYVEANTSQRQKRWAKFRA